MLRVYMAGPLFTTAEREFNVRLAKLISRLEPRANCVLPQVQGEKLYPDLNAVFKDCLYQIRHADVVVACADGADTDSGTAFELGFAHAISTPCIVYRTDFRGSEVDGVNAMLRFGCTEFINVPSFNLNEEALADRIAAAIRNIYPLEQMEPSQCP